MSPSNTPQAADTNNWDTAFAIRFGDANKAIVAANSSPSSFSAPYTDGLSGQQYTIAGNFGAWQLSGGSGGIVHMTLPITTGSLTPQGAPAKNYSGSAVIEVYLDFIPQPGAPSSGGQTNNLQVKLTTKDPVNEPIVSVQSFTFDPSSPLQQGAEAIESALGAWLNGNLQSFNHTFAAVDLNAVADQGTYQWLKPTKIGYAVNAPDDVTPDQYIFGVLAMTESRDNPNLSNQISPNIIPAGANAGFLISQERFINKMFLPGVYLIFKGASAANFSETNDGTTVTNNQPLNFQNFVLEDGTVINDASVGTGKFTLTAFDQALEMQFTDLNFTWKPGYIVHLTYTGMAALSLDANHNIQMTPTGKPSLSVVVTKTTAEQWKEIVEGIVEGIALSVAGAVIGGALGPAAEEAGEAADTAASDAADSAEDGADSMDFSFDGPDADSINNPDEVSSQNESDASDDLENADDESYASKLKGWFGRNWVKVLGGAIGSALGVVLGKLPDILEAYAEKNLAEMPTLDDFAEEAVSPIAWPNSTGYTLASGALNRSLQLGISVAFAGAAPAQRAGAGGQAA